MKKLIIFALVASATAFALQKHSMSISEEIESMKVSDHNERVVDVDNQFDRVMRYPFIDFMKDGVLLNSINLEELDPINKSIRLKEKGRYLSLKKEKGKYFYFEIKPFSGNKAVLISTYYSNSNSDELISGDVLLYSFSDYGLINYIKKSQDYHYLGGINELTLDGRGGIILSPTSAYEKEDFIPFVFGDNQIIFIKHDLKPSARSKYFVQENNIFMHDGRNLFSYENGSWEISNLKIEKF